MTSQGYNKHIPTSEDLTENLLAVRKWMLDCHLQKADKTDWFTHSMLLTHLHDFVVLPQRLLIMEMMEALEELEDPYNTVIISDLITKAEVMLK